LGTGSYLLVIKCRILKKFREKRQLVEANQKLIEIFERKIQAKLAEI
jgi:hypothetical protein